MLYTFIYLVIGAIVSVLTWIYYTSNWSNRKIPENVILIYLPICTILWPICIINICYEFYKYLKVKWDF